MRKLSVLFLIVALFVVGVFPAMAQGGGEGEELPSIVEIAAGNEDFSTLVAAVEAAGLVDFFASSKPITVFAPTNAAFEAAFRRVRGLFDRPRWFPRLRLRSIRFQRRPSLRHEGLCRLPEGLHRIGPPDFDGLGPPSGIAQFRSFSNPRNRHEIIQWHVNKPRFSTCQRGAPENMGKPGARRAH